jgi:hypothetical protein
METSRRLGKFLILVGLTLLVIFVGSILSKVTNVTFLLLSFIALLAGFLLRRNKEVKDSGRFSMIHRARERSRQRREERMSQRQKNKH